MLQMLRCFTIFLEKRKIILISQLIITKQNYDSGNMVDLIHVGIVQGIYVNLKY